jgi:hypothetical protein
MGRLTRLFPCGKALSNRHQVALARHGRPPGSAGSISARYFGDWRCKRKQDRRGIGRLVQFLLIPPHEFLRLGKFARLELNDSPRPRACSRGTPDTTSLVPQSSASNTASRSFETSNCTCAPVRRRPQLRPISARMKYPARRDSSTAESRRLRGCASGAEREEGALVHSVQRIGRCAGAIRGLRIRSRPRR